MLVSWLSSSHVLCYPTAPSTRLFLPHMATEVYHVGGTSQHLWVTAGERVFLQEGGDRANGQYSWSLRFKCGLTWSVIPKLLMWESHGRAMKAATVVSVMDDLWEVWISRHYREPPWALMIDAVSSAILFTFSPLHCASPSGQKHTARGRLFSERGRAHTSPQPQRTAVNTGQNTLSIAVLLVIITGHALQP